MAQDTQPKSYGSLIISALLSALLTVIVFSYSGLKSDIERLDQKKAEADVVSVKLESINSKLNEISEILKERRK